MTPGRIVVVALLVIAYRLRWLFAAFAAAVFGTLWTLRGL